MTPMFVILLIAVFLLGICLGILYEERLNRKRTVEEPVGPKTDWKATRVPSKKVNFNDQLDPVMPEGTKRNPFVEKEEKDDEYPGYFG